MNIGESTLLITGGASGLGAACGRRLVQAGAQVVLADLNVKSGQSLADELGDRARFIETDVTSESDMERAVDLAIHEFSKLDGVITCAGVLGGSRVVGRDGPHDLALFRRVIDINLVGTFNAVRLAANAMATNAPDADGQRGVVVMTSSVATWDGQIGQSAYAASKGAVSSMTLPMARELGRFGIRVVSIAPGVFETQMMAGVTDEIRTSLESQVPFPSRLGQPDEFAQLVQQVIENLMLNGTTLRLDGALRMGPR